MSKCDFVCQSGVLDVEMSGVFALVARFWWGRCDRDVWGDGRLR